MIKAHKVLHGLDQDLSGVTWLNQNDLINTGSINTKEVSYPLVSVRGIQVGCNFLTGNPQQWCLADGNL